MVSALSTSPGELFLVTLLLFFTFGVLPFPFVDFLLGDDFEEENKPEKGLGSTQHSIKYARHEKTNAVPPKTNAIYVG